MDSDLPPTMNDGSRHGRGVQLDVVLTLLYGDDNLWYNVVHRFRQRCFLAGRCRGGSRFPLTSQPRRLSSCFFFFFLFCVINYTFFCFYLSLSLPSSPPFLFSPLCLWWCMITAIFPCFFFREKGAGGARGVICFPALILFHLSKW